MSSTILFPFSKPNFRLILLFFLFYFPHLPCALSQPDLKSCDKLFHCGNISAGFPFWGAARPEPCGHPSLGLHCDQNSSKTYFIFSGQMYSVFFIDNSTNTLGLARQDFLGVSFCNSTLTGTTLTNELFQLSPEYTTLFVYYLCEPHLPNPANFKCPKIGIASMHQSNENHGKCSAGFNITVPTSYVPERETLNLTRLQIVLQKGFEVKLKIDGSCQECKSTGGVCGYDVGIPVCCKRNSSSEIKCNPMLPSGPYKTAKPDIYFHAGLSKTAKIGIGVASGFLGSVATGLLLFMAFSSGIRNKKTAHHQKYQNLRTLVQLKQYSYAEVKKITKSFSHTVGKGGFGTVYGGNLCDGRKVAVKIMKDFKSNGEDFINEVASMSQTSHVNIVSLLGFCYEGPNRAIVYEFLENGSLDQFISRNTSLNLDMSTLYGIALGVARGVEYLHHGCKTRIVHFDIKPQNVLLDDNLCPKVSDFGLAKLCEKRESILSFLDTRGTIGYIAPEVFSRLYGRVSHKSDVYSYGMLVLEMMGARNKETEENVVSNSSSAYFPDSIYKYLENGEHTWVIGDDTRDGTIEEKEIARKMILVGLWCIQPCPSNRPPMNRVVEMMEGSLGAIEVPPKPSMQISRTPLPDSSCLSELDSNNSEELI